MILNNTFLLEDILDPVFSIDSNRNVHREQIPVNEEITAEVFAGLVNSGVLSVSAAYEHFWSYDENEKLWDVSGRSILPDWEPILLQMVSFLDDGYLDDFVDITSESYFNTRNHFEKGEYNPFESQLELSVIFLRENKSARVRDVEFLEKISNLALKEGDIDSVRRYLKLSENSFLAKRLLYVIEHDFLSMDWFSIHDLTIYSNTNLLKWANEDSLKLSSYSRKNLISSIIDFVDD
jgi:hypothetical protein